MSDSFSRYDVYTTVRSKYCYEYSSVLRNRFEIKDNAVLKAVESDIYAIKQNSLLNEPLKGNLSPAHLCRIHKFLFGDVYAFAGHYRREDISKGHTMFLHYEKIPAELSKLLAELKADGYLKCTSEEKLKLRLSYYLASLNYIHPFREGNGRTTREFIRLIMEKTGYTADWNRIDHDYLLTLMEASVFDYKVLVPLFEQISVPLVQNAEC